MITCPKCKTARNIKEAPDCPVCYYAKTKEEKDFWHNQYLKRMKKALDAKPKTMIQ